MTIRTIPTFGGTALLVALIMGAGATTASARTLNVKTDRNVSRLPAEDLNRMHAATRRAEDRARNGTRSERNADLGRGRGADDGINHDIGDDRGGGRGGRGRGADDGANHDAGDDRGGGDRGGNSSDRGGDAGGRGGEGGGR